LSPKNPSNLSPVSDFRVHFTPYYVHYGPSGLAGAIEADSARTHGVKDNHE
jgi:hypothetical protein